MRISADKRDKGYENFQIQAQEIYLNGKPYIDNICRTADEELGYIICFAGHNNTSGYLKDTDGEYLYKIYYGDVKIKLSNTEDENE